MPHFPIFLSLKQKNLLMIGAGPVALRKIKSLLSFEPNIKVVALEAHPEILKMAEEGKIEVNLRSFCEEDLEGAEMVFIAINDQQKAVEIGKKAKERGIPVNIANSPEDSTFYFPALVQEGDFVIGISTSGQSPALSRAFRMILEQKLKGKLEGLVQKWGLQRISMREITSEAILEEVEEVFGFQKNKEPMFHGRVKGIYITSKKGGKLERQKDVEVIAGKGIVGDRHFREKGGFKEGKEREISLIERETLLALERDYQITLLPEESRRNILTEGVPLNHLVGKTFCVGPLVLKGTMLCNPCRHLEKLTYPGVQEALKHRGGLLAKILKGGTLKEGDPIYPSDGECLENFKS